MGRRRASLPSPWPMGSESRSASEAKERRGTNVPAAARPRSTRKRPSLEGLRSF